MENTISPSKHAVNYGVYYGVLLILEFVIMYALDLNPIEYPFIGTIINVLNYLIFPFLFIYIAANAFKNEINNGFISMSQTLKTGVTTTVIAAVIYGVFYILFDLIFPEFKDKLFELTQEITIKQNPNMTSDQLKMSMKFVKIFMNPLITAPFTIVMYALLGVIHSLIVGAVIKKDKPVF